VQFHHLTSRGESNAGTGDVPAHICRSVELFKKVGQVRGRETDARVAHGHDRPLDHSVKLSPELDVDLSALRAVLKEVCEIGCYR
jgi:hypothetical protein